MGGLVITGGLLYYFNGKISTGVEVYLRRAVFTDSASARFDSVHVDLLKGRFSMRGLWLRRTAGGRSATLRVKTVSAFASVRDFLSEKSRIRRIVVEEPALEVSPVKENIPSGEFTGFRRGFVEELIVSEGTFRWVEEGGDAVFDLHSIEGKIEFSDEGAVQTGVEARIPSADPGRLNVVVNFPASSEDFDGEIRLTNFSLPYAARLFPPDPDVKIAEGTADLKTQFTCKKGWLTASHLVEIKNLNVEVSEERKKIFGLSVEKLKDVLKIENLSFVVPMNGSLSDPHVGFAVSLEQILLKVLENKIPDPGKRANLARRGGNYLGNKMDKAVNEWRAERR